MIFMNTIINILTRNVSDTVHELITEVAQQ